MKRYETVPFADIDINSGFWQYQQQLNREVTIGAVRDRFMETGRFNAFQLNWREGMEKKPHRFWDSDFAKWAESVSYVLKKYPAPEMQELIEHIIDLIEAGQCSDGYFNIYYTNVEPSNRFQQRWSHELYCAGHLLEAAIAYDDATGRDRFLKIMLKYIDYIDRIFRQEHSAAFVTPGHPELELALMKLYRYTGEERYLTLAKWFVDQRGLNEREAQDGSIASLKYDQSQCPIRDMDTAEGHSVRLGYLFSGVADVARETQDESLFAACRRVFENIVFKRMYITGGVGSIHGTEGFTVDYDLPNEIAYAETCAAISLAYFAQRMLTMDADSLYADVVETVLYNGFLSGLSLDGKRFFYTNPLAISQRDHMRNRAVDKNRSDWLPDTQRVEVFGCSCCPPNVTRFIASVGDYMYTTGENRIYIHQYISSEAHIPVSEKALVVRQETDYPVSGRVRLTVEHGDGIELAVRVPGWCANYSLDQPHTLEKGYAIVRVTGDCFKMTLDMTMKPELVEANPEVEADAGRVALRRGPVIYCLEEVDNEQTPHDLMVDANMCAREEYNAEMRLPVIHARGWKRATPQGNWLYRPFDAHLEEKDLTFIPYYAFANRGESDMEVWVLVKR